MTETLITQAEAEELRAAFAELSTELVEVRATLDQGISLLSKYDPTTSKPCAAMTLEEDERNEEAALQDGC